MVVMFIAKLLKYHLIYQCYFEILLKVNCSPFRSTRVHPGYLRGSCCSIFSFLCRNLLIVVCLFVLFLLTIVFSVFFDIQILITPLVSSNFSYICSWIVIHPSLQQKEVMSFISFCDKVYSIQYYVITFVSDLLVFSGYLFFLHQ